MKILVTGAGGFIGSHLCEALIEKGYEVRALVHYNSNNFQGWLESSRLRDKMDIVAGDVRDSDSVNKAMIGCQSVFHLAALIGIPYSYQSPLAYIRTNVEGTYNILQAAREQNCENTIVTSTSETYGTAQYVPIDEKHPLVGQSPYSASKISADQFAISFHRSFGVPVKIVRPFNTYGPRQSARAIIPTIITQLLNEHDEIHLGNIAPTRDFTYVKDTVEGFISVLESKELFGEVVNVGMGEETSIGDLVKHIAKLLNKEVKIVEDKQRVRDKESEVERLCCNNTKLITNVAWTPRYNLDQGLSETISWIRDNLTNYKADIYNV